MGFKAVKEYFSNLKDEDLVFHKSMEGCVSVYDNRPTAKRNQLGFFDESGTFNSHAHSSAFSKESLAVIEQFRSTPDTIKDYIEPINEFDASFDVYRIHKGRITLYHCEVDYRNIPSGARIVTNCGILMDHWFGSYEEVVKPVLASIEKLKLKEKEVRSMLSKEYSIFLNPVIKPKEDE